MQKILLSAVLFGLGSSAIAADQTALNYNVVQLQAEASREVSNDQMQVVLYVEKTSKQPADLAAQITQNMNAALRLSQKYPQIQTKTGTQSTYPIYTNENRSLKEWRARAEIRFQTHDFKAMSQLISELQSSFQTESIQFTVSDQQRQLVENELITEASQNFQKRAKSLVQVWNKTNYQVVSLNVETNNQQYTPQPYMRASFAKMAAADAPVAQDISAGNSKINVNINGSIQLEK